MNLFSSLGIDWQTLILQIIAFVILVFLVAKYVVPILLKSVDARQEAIEESLKAAKDARGMLDDAEAKAAEYLKGARAQASDILATAKEEATSAVDGARDKAAREAERIVKDAHEQLGRDIENARVLLRNETIELVASAAEGVARVKVDAKTDARAIETALSSASASPLKEAA